jgi:hypothetical protein
MPLATKKSARDSGRFFMAVCAPKNEFTEPSGRPEVLSEGDWFAPGA